MESEPPPTLRDTPAPTMDQIRLDPQDKLTPHPSDTLSTKHPPTGPKSACGLPPEDNFWNSPYGPRLSKGDEVPLIVVYTHAAIA